jgi:N-acetylmuramoyl-L-alanine amidase
MNRTSSKTFYSVNLSIILILLMVNINTTIVNAKPLIKIAVDPGHGGYDPGVVLNGIIEKNVSLDISKRLEHHLGQFGYNVIMTRKTDTALYKLSKKGTSFKTRDLKARVNIINNSGTKLFASIHVNSDVYSKKSTGSIVYYYSKSSKSKALADSIQNSLNNITINNQKRQQHKSRPANFYILRKTRAPGVLIETAFISNKGERKLLKNENFKNKIALAIAKGIKNSKMHKDIIIQQMDLYKNIKKSIRKSTKKVVHIHKKT